MRRLLAVSLFALLPAVQAFAAAAPPAPPPTLPTPAERCAKQADTRAMRLGQLETAMKLTAEQKPLFETWKSVRLEVARGLPCPPPPTGMGVPTPTRLQSQITMMTATLDALRKEQAPTEALYKVLTPEQRQMFDTPMRVFMQAAAPQPPAKPQTPPAKPAQPTPKPAPAH